MTTAHQRNFITDVARATVMVIAPDETEDFDTVAEAFWERPERVRNLYRENDAIGGFGGVEAAILAPAVLYIAAEVGKFLLEAVRDGTGEHIGDVVKGLLGRLRGARSLQSSQPQDMLQVDQTRIATAERQGLEAATTLGIPEHQARLIINTVIVNFVRADSPASDVQQGS